jgi:hypothetical protein
LDKSTVPLNEYNKGTIVDENMRNPEVVGPNISASAICVKCDCPNLVFVRSDFVKNFFIFFEISLMESVSMDKS